MLKVFKSPVLLMLSFVAILFVAIGVTLHYSPDMNNESSETYVSGPQSNRDAFLAYSPSSTSVLNLIFDKSENHGVKKYNIEYTVYKLTSDSTEEVLFKSYNPVQFEANSPSRVYPVTIKVPKSLQKDGTYSYQFIYHK